MPASIYRQRADRMTVLNPNRTAHMTAAEAPMTEKKPFIPHAQGMRSFLALSSRLSPEGKGMPIGTAMGAIMILHASIRIQRGRWGNVPSRYSPDFR